MPETEYDPEELVFAKQAAKRLGLSHSLVNLAVKNGLIKEAPVAYEDRPPGPARVKVWMRWGDVVEWSRRPKKNGRKKAPENVQPKANPGCDTCELAKTHPKSETGFQCSIAKNYTCKPWIFGLHHEEIKYDS